MKMGTNLKTSAVLNEFDEHRISSTWFKTIKTVYDIEGFEIDSSKKDNSINCMNPILDSTGVKIRENRILQKNQGILMKEDNILFVGNIYPFMFLGCGKNYTLDQCIDFSINYALDLINKKIESYR